MVVDFPEPVGPVIRIRPCSRAPHRVRSHSGTPSAFNVGTLVLMRRRTAAEAAHGAVQAHAVARMRARDEAAVAIHVAVALRVRAAGLPEGGDVRERQGFFPEHNDLFIDLKPRYLVLLKEDVARLLLLRGVENAVDVLRHGSQLLPRGIGRKPFLTDLKSTQEVSLLGIYREQWLIITSAAVTSNHRIDHLESVTGPDERAPC